jgi:large subunit ribosomal protein L31
MKEGIHPKYQAATFTCSCGNAVKTSATIGNQHIEICGNCHPFYTGKSKLVDTAGRVERFNARYAALKTATK